MILTRVLELDEVEAASVLMWKSFYYSNKDSSTLSGFEFFRDKTQTAVLQYEMLYNGLKLIGAFDADELMGVCAFKEQRIILLFVSKENQNKGVGLRLLNEALAEIEGDVYLDSSLSALGFYLKQGFSSCGEKSFENGIMTQPMVLKRANN